MIELSGSQLASFKDKGVLVIENVFTPLEVQTAREGLTRSLALYGVDPQNLEDTGQNLRKLSSTSGAGGVIDLFYADWKFQVAENPKLFSIISQLWEATYAPCSAESNSSDENAGLFAHPHGPFDPKHGYFYIDRVGYRVPERISHLHSKSKKPLQRSLTPHLDCCPIDLYGNIEKIDENLRRWRPIQAIVALTPNWEPNTGGFEAVPGFHKRFNEYFLGGRAGTTKEREIELDDPDIARVCVGEFSPLVPKFDHDVLSQFEHIPYGTGSVICWDWRLPHANSQYNNGESPREVVYTGFLPDVPVNRRFSKAQYENYQKGALPNHVWHHHQYSEDVKEGLTFEFSDLGRKLMAIDSW